MSNIFDKRFVVSALLGTLLIAVSPIWACSVPVFRYALERWQADEYVAVVFHRGELTDEQKALVNKLGRDGLAGASHANLHLETLDLETEIEPGALELWKAQKTETLPWLVIHYPPQTRIAVPAWSGPLSESAVDSLIDSPLRREIARRLLKGQTAVWVLLEIGDKKKDDAAYTLISEQLQHLETTLKLPEIAEEDIAQGLVMIDPDELKLKFSLIRLSRENPDEKMFVEMLVGSEPSLVPEEKSLREFNEPMVFPMFGRGRALYALVGAGINQETIATAGADLTGPCTCTVKEQNPGVDMLMAVDWNTLVEPFVEIDKELPPLAGLGEFGTPLEPPQEAPDQVVRVAEETAETSSTIPSGIDSTHIVTSSGSLMRNVLIAVGLAFAAVVAGSIFLGSKTS